MIDTPIINRMTDAMLVHHYLLASYCYYHLDMSPMTDHAFDRLCVRLLEKYDGIKKGRAIEHIKFVNKDDLEAGTCLLAYEDFPSRVHNNAYDYYGKAVSGQLAALLEPHLEATKTVTRVSRRSTVVAQAQPPAPAVKRISRRSS